MIELLLVSLRPDLLGAAAVLLLAAVLSSEREGGCGGGAARRAGLVAVALAGVKRDRRRRLAPFRPWLPSSLPAISSALGGAHHRAPPHCLPRRRVLRPLVRLVRARRRGLLAPAPPRSATPRRPITIYPFDSAEQKQRFMGAATPNRRPWRREIYIQWDGLPHPVLAQAGPMFAAASAADLQGGAQRPALTWGLVGGGGGGGDPRAPGRCRLTSRWKAMRRQPVEPPLSVFGWASGRGRRRAPTPWPALRALPPSSSAARTRWGRCSAPPATRPRGLRAQLRGAGRRLVGPHRRHPARRAPARGGGPSARAARRSHKVCAHTPIAARRRQAARRAAAGDAQGALRGALGVRRRP